mmetsp:Transcript_90758/g.292950  ORF Transcript_90758/g.292950 Transcript_90758/m.292950 type:complete len:222 (+) Transcript_90758:2943-3608(+)
MAANAAPLSFAHVDSTLCIQDERCSTATPQAARCCSRRSARGAELKLAATLTASKRARSTAQASRTFGSAASASLESSLAALSSAGGAHASSAVHGNAAPAAHAQLLCSEAARSSPPCICCLILSTWSCEFKLCTAFWRCRASATAATSRGVCVTAREGSLATRGFRATGPSVAEASSSPAAAPGLEAASLVVLSSSLIVACSCNECSPSALPTRAAGGRV